MTEAERFLRKARESLASAEADLEAGRFNSCANRSYYAAFQTAVAALIHEGIRPVPKKGEQPDWQHRFVISQFSGKLVWRRNVYQRELLKSLDELFRGRLDADYRPDGISERAARRSLLLARELLEAADQRMKQRSPGEAKVRYEEAMKTTTRKRLASYVEAVKERLLASYPGLEFNVYKRGPRDFTLEVIGDDEDMWEVTEVLDDLPAMILVEHDVWIVVLTKRRDSAAA